MVNRLAITGIIILIAYLMGTGRSSGETLSVAVLWQQKVTFSLGSLDEQGLWGPPTGKRVLDYEFCIPRTTRHVAEIKAIDPTIRIQPGRGRIDCTTDQYLCLGTTHHDYRKVLETLIQLDYVNRIDQTVWE